jgi:hypothetical protein
VLLLIRHGLPLPTDRCFKCNKPARVTKAKNLSWHHPSIYLGLLAGVLIYIILVLCLQKRATVIFGLCEPCNNRRILWISIWSACTLSIIPLMTWAITQETGPPAIAGGILFFAGLIGLLISGRIGVPRRIDDSQILLSGSGESYRRTFPQV